MGPRRARKDTSDHPSLFDRKHRRTPDQNADEWGFGISNDKWGHDADTRGNTRVGLDFLKELYSVGTEEVACGVPR